MIRFPSRAALSAAAAVATLLALAAPSLAQRGPDRLSVPAPQLTGDRWLNADAKEIPSLRRLQGSVTVLHFWTFG
jgi:hypothetical protein